MESYVKLLLFILLAVMECIMAIVAIVKGISKRKATGNLTHLEQENDLRKFMVDECSNVERFSKFLKATMSKQELAEYKRSTVLKNMKLYAQANNYIWYNEGVWGDVLTKYISDANTASGKVVSAK